MIVKLPFEAAVAVPSFEREGDLTVVRVEMGSVSDQLADAIDGLALIGRETREE